MAPAQIECMAKQPDGRHAWTPVRTVPAGAIEHLSASGGDVLLTGTKQGFSLQRDNQPIDDVSASDTDEFELPTAVRRITTSEGELQIRAVTEK